MAKTKAQKIGAIQAKIEHKRIKTSIREYRSTQFKNGLGFVFGTLLLVILLVNVFRIANDGKVVSVTSLLNFLSSVDVSFQVPNLSSLTNAFTIANEWAVLDGFRVFLNGLGTILGIIAYLGANLVYSITFLAKFIVYLLG